MSTLTGQQIQNSYQGLLKLDNSTTGITENLQAIQDGLGNNTGLRIATDLLEAPNIPSFIPLKARYYGTGFQNTGATQLGNGTQNVILANIFLDGGEYSYSAITINTQNITSSSDTVEMALYTAQMINPHGLFPHIPVISGITADTTTTGLKTFVFPSHISFSGYGGGYYFIVFKISNSGVQPTWRGGQTQYVAAESRYGNQILGITETFTSLTYSPNVIRMNNTNNNLMVFSGLTTFDNPYSNTINTAQSSSTFTGNGLGLILHTVDA